MLRKSTGVQETSTVSFFFWISEKKITNLYQGMLYLQYKIQPFQLSRMPSTANSHVIIWICDVIWENLSHMWGDQAEWVVCRQYWFWDTSNYSMKIPLYLIVFSWIKLCISLEPWVRFWWGFQQNKAFWLLYQMDCKSKIW